ncbi:MAG: Maf family nucleotide pyrophosphatase [Candidatus Thiodiazotropha sp.]|jgi:septum formation protein
MHTAISHPHLPLILASSSPYRREVLSRLGIEFSSVSPEIDESPMEGETLENQVRRLAESKALAVAASHPRALIIGSDQLAALDERVMGKPGNHQRAIEQLTMLSGRRVTFFTGLCLLNSDSGERQVCCETYHVEFRNLTEEEVEHYLRKEQPYNCAGAFKSEGLGVCLFKRMEGDDPASLIGLPLIQLVNMLRNQGLDVLLA